MDVRDHGVASLGDSKHAKNGNLSGVSGVGREGSEREREREKSSQGYVKTISFKFQQIEEVA